MYLESINECCTAFSRDKQSLVFPCPRRIIVWQARIQENMLEGAPCIGLFQPDRHPFPLDGLGGGDAPPPESAPV